MTCQRLALTALTLLLLTAQTAVGKIKITPQQAWPDGTPMETWFTDTAKIDAGMLGNRYCITDYGVQDDSTTVQTEALQRVIDRCAADGGGVVVIPRGMTVLSGALFFKPKTHLHIEEGGRLKGIDDIRHYPLIDMHMEGKMIKYFAALVTAIGCDGFTITGRGTIDGDARRFWDEFWIRRKMNPKCTNLEAMRPQLVYIAESDDVTVQDVRLVNSAFWTNHLYKCSRAKYIDCYIESPTVGATRAPSSDGLDLDICTDVVVRGCFMNICDDGVCLKGGKGTYVDRDSTAGPVRRVLVEKCRFGRLTNAGITFGSEAWDCQNIVLRDSRFEGSGHALLFKMRTDTPQTYQDVLMERCTGWVTNAVETSSWKQFHQLEERADMPTSVVRNVTIRNISDLRSKRFFYVVKDRALKHQFNMENFTLQDINVSDSHSQFDIEHVKNVLLKDVVLNDEKKD